MGEKDFKRVLEKSRYNDDNDEWVIPFLKRKSIDVVDNNNNSNNNSFHQRASSAEISNGSNNGGSGNNMLPDIHQNKSREREKESDKFDQVMRFPLSNGGDDTGNVKTKNNKMKSKESRGFESTSSPVVPLLTLPGALISASSLYDLDHNEQSKNNYMTTDNTAISQQSNGNFDRDFPYSGRGGIETLPGIGFTGKETDKEKKKKLPGLMSNNNSNIDSMTMDGVTNGNREKKIPKIPNGGGRDNRMPNIDSKPQSSLEQPVIIQSYYADDEDFSEGLPSGRQKKKKRNNDSGKEVVGGSSRGNSSALPPIDLKNGTPRTSSLPPI
jgi:hypothetical protein